MKKNIKNNREIEFVNYLRGFAVISILLCHYMPESSNVYLQMSAQFFNIGVNIFIIISGFCLGLQGEITDVKLWYRKRLKRIYIPYWIFLLSIVYIVKRLRFNFLNWLSCILGIQGANVGVWGADHTWFITAILICYLITPLISKRFHRKRMIEGLAFGGPLIFAIIPWPFVFTLFSPVCFYSLAYFAGRKYKENSMTFSKAIVTLVILSISFIVRIGTKIFMDGTILYDRIVVTYTQYIAAFAIFVLFAFVFKNIKSNRLCKKFCEISFEVYLCHYMFVVGPISLMEITTSFVVNMIIITFVSCGMAVILHYIAKKIQKRIE